VKADKVGRGFGRLEKFGEQNCRHKTRLRLVVTRRNLLHKTCKRNMHITACHPLLVLDSDKRKQKVIGRITEPPDGLCLLSSYKIEILMEISHS
jgi:hypothetical protein